MSDIRRTEVVEPKGLSPADLTRLTDALYNVHSEIFDGVSREEFARYVVESSADETHIQLSYGEGDELAGYIAFHAFRRVFREEACTVTRAEAGLRRAYRGNGSQGSFFLSRLLKTRWKYGGPHYYLGCLVHPSSYTAFARDGTALWPAPGAEIPDDIFDFMMQLGEEFHLAMVDPSRPLVRTVGWITRDTEVERRYWQTTDQRAPRFFIEQNPGYTRGHGLLTLVDFSPASLGKAVVTWSGAKLKKTAQRALGSLERTLVKPRMDEKQAEDLLSTIEAKLGLSLDAIRDLGVLGARFPVPARAVLFRAGEQADAMYVLLQGSAFVLDVGPSGEEVVIDQLGPSTLVGEMALVMDQPRTATVRAATDSVFLRLTKPELDQLLATAPALADALWAYIGRRVFGLQMRSLPAFSSLTWDQRESWFDAGACRALGAGEEVASVSDGVVVLSLGRLFIESPQGWLSLSAPATCTIPAGAKVTALAASRIAILPAGPPPERNVARITSASPER